MSAEVACQSHTVPFIQLSEFLFFPLFLFIITVTFLAAYWCTMEYLPHISPDRLSSKWSIKLIFLDHFLKVYKGYM